MVEAVRSRNANEKAMARLNNPDNICKDSPACHKIIPSGSFRPSLPIVVHRSLDKIVVGTFGPQSAMVNLSGLEKQFGNRFPSLGTRPTIQNHISSGHRVFVYLTIFLTLFGRFSAKVVRLTDNE